MAWSLYIHQIDVGQGDSSLIVAHDSRLGGTFKTMLIDGGLGVNGQVINQYMNNTGVNNLDYIVLTHYDQDHYDGIGNLLIADNFTNIISTLANTVVSIFRDLPNGTSTPNALAVVAGTLWITIHGAYTKDNTRHKLLIDVVNKILAENFPSNVDLNMILNTGTGIAKNCRDYYSRREIPKVYRSLIVSNEAIKKAIRHGTITVNKVLSDSSIQFKARNIQERLYTILFHTLKSTVPSSAHFWTKQRCKNTQIIDLGNRTLPSQYIEIINGTYTQTAGGNTTVKAPNINRGRKSVTVNDLGMELFWSTTGGAPPNNAPQIFLMACHQVAWPNTRFSAIQANNDVGIALMLRFNNFHFYTGGDLSYTGEEAIAAAVMNQGLPMVGGGNFPAPPRIACFKVGHHGAATSSSANFLNAIQPACGLISCGKQASHEHPVQAVIDRLNSNSSFIYFLTNCRYITQHIPASSGYDQLTSPNHRSRVAGDNSDDRGSEPGHIRVAVQETAVTGPNRSFTVAYYDADNNIEHFRVEEVDFN